MFQHFEPQVMDFMGKGSEMSSAAQLEAYLESLNAIPNRINWAVIIIESGAVAGRISYSSCTRKGYWKSRGWALQAPATPPSSGRC